MASALAGKVAAVTAGGRGIGRAVSLLLAAEGAKVVVNDYGVAVDGTRPSEGPAADVADIDVPGRANAGPATAGR